MRAVLAKIEAQYKKLRTKKEGVESKFTATEDTELATRFVELVGEGFRRCKETGLT